MLNALAGLIAGLPPRAVEIIGIWVAALLTLAVLSYLFGSNPVFRVAEYLFVGVAAGYAAALAWNNVLWPRLALLLEDPGRYWYYGLFFALGLMLLTRGIKSLSVLGNLPLGVLFGTGAALALGGALTGSLIPQMQATVVSVSPAHYGPGAVGLAYALDALILVVGTLAVLSAFHFTAGGRGLLGWLGQGLLRVLGKFGRGLIMITLGALIAGAALTFFTVLSSRLLFLLQDWGRLFGEMGL